ncbi:MAG: ThiF family adenylyltransferase [Niabella sp.]
MNNVVKNNEKQFSTDYSPLFLNLHQATDNEHFNQIIKDNNPTVYNTITEQLVELLRVKNPGIRFSPEEVKLKTDEILGGVPLNNYGNWVYYSWSNTLVHLLPEDDFIAVRTNRNMYKISPEELLLLRTKKIGIIGLSVGQSIAQTIATERICGELRLADFDSLELSNLNRLNASVMEIGVPKVIIAARKIAEIDPYIKVKCWPQGITENNIDSFLTDAGKLDVLVEECDGFDIKVLSRIKAKALSIPVVMDTNDVGMLDVERFDLEKERAIFHGKVPELENIPVTELVQKLKTLSFQEKLGYLTKIIGFENTSEEMRYSLSQLHKTINGWPQLASAVVLGAAVVTDVCRRICLDKFTGSGRFFVHVNELIK